MAESNVEPDPDWSNRPSDTAEDTLVAMESLLTTLRALEAELRQREISEISSTEYCDNFCQVACITDSSDIFIWGMFLHSFD